MSEIETKTCKECRATYLGVTWIKHRVDGFCSDDCVKARDKRLKKKKEFEASINKKNHPEG